MNALSAILVWFVAWPFTTMWRSYVVITLWGWFVMPVLHISAPSIYWVAGMMMTLFMILPFQHAKKSEKQPLEAVIDSFLIYGLIGPAIVLGMAWVWKWLQWGIA